MTFGVVMIGNMPYPSDDYVLVPRKPTPEMLKAADGIASSVGGAPWAPIRYPAGVGPEDVWEVMIRAFERALPPITAPTP